MNTHTPLSSSLNPSSTCLQAPSKAKIAVHFRGDDYDIKIRVSLCGKITEAIRNKICSLFQESMKFQEETCAKPLVTASVETAVKVETASEWKEIEKIYLDAKNIETKAKENPQEEIYSAKKATYTPLPSQAFRVETFGKIEKVSHHLETFHALETFQPNNPLHQAVAHFLPEKATYTPLPSHAFRVETFGKMEKVSRHLETFHALETIQPNNPLHQAVAHFLPEKATYTPLSAQAFHITHLQKLSVKVKKTEDLDEKNDEQLVEKDELSYPLFVHQKAQAYQTFRSTELMMSAPPPHEETYFPIILTKTAYLLYASTLTIFEPKKTSSMPLQPLSFSKVTKVEKKLFQPLQNEIINFKFKKRLVDFVFENATLKAEKPASLFYFSQNAADYIARKKEEHRVEEEQRQQNELMESNEWDEAETSSSSFYTPIMQPPAPSYLTPSKEISLLQEGDNKLPTLSRTALTREELRRQITGRDNEDSDEDSEIDYDFAGFD